MKKAKRKPFDLMVEFGKFGLEHGLSLREPRTLSAFTAHVAEAVGGAIDDPGLLHSLGVEALFEALVVSLGAFRARGWWACVPQDRYRIPDFRLVLEDGQQWLVEVKNAYVSHRHEQQRTFLTREELERARAYAEATRAELKLAVYWARWAIWTLVAPERFTDEQGDVTLEMLSAYTASELAALGDRTIGTRAPLRLRLVMDPKKTSPIGQDGRVYCVIGSGAIYCGDEEITDPIEQQIAWLFMQHGEWAGSEGIPLIDGDRLEAIEFTWQPEERSGEGFEVIGLLSRMFSRFFAGQTVSDGKVVQLRATSRPGWFDPFVKDEKYIGKALPLWRFVVKPADGTSPSCAGADAPR